MHILLSCPLFVSEILIKQCLSLELHLHVDSIELKRKLWSTRKRKQHNASAYCLFFVLLFWFVLNKCFHGYGFVFLKTSPREPNYDLKSKKQKSEKTIVFLQPLFRFTNQGICWQAVTFWTSCLLCGDEPNVMCFQKQIQTF